MTTRVLFKKLVEHAVPFAYSRKDDACMDMYSSIEDTIPPHTTRLIRTGIALEIPEGYEGIVRGRSGLASKGIIVHQGTIDETYRGDVSVIVYNNTDQHFKVDMGMRIAQFTIKPVYRVLLEESELSDTERGSNGFGSSGL